MKRIILTGLALGATLTLLYSGNRIIAHVLDAELPGLLSRELSIPVSLEPTRAWAPTLTVHSPRLVMGDPSNPALVVTQVSVSLDWTDLLRGEIRLRRASGDKLMVNPTLWPGNDNPWPSDYRFLDPYLPNDMALELASYVAADGDSHEFRQPRWQRTAEGISLSWQDGLDGKSIGISAILASLDELLRLAQVRLQLTATAPGNVDSAIAAAIVLQPAEQSGYSLAADITAAGMSAAVASGNSRNWELPDHSSTSIKQLNIARLQALAGIYLGESAGEGSKALQAPALPRLSLPVHEGRVSIGEIRWQDEVGTDTRFDFSTGPAGVNVPSLSSSGPEGRLQGQLSIADSAAGWQVGLTAELQAATPGTRLTAPFADSDWIWRQGSARISGQGVTWEGLLNALQGDIALSGFHRGAVKTPVSITARLDTQPGQFALETIDMELADGRVTGSVALSGGDPKQLRARVRAENLKLDFLLPPADKAAPPGMALPTYLLTLPGVELDWELELNNVALGGANISQGSISFTRTPQQANLAASIGDGDGGKLDLKLGAKMAPGKPTAVELGTELSNLSISQLFGQAPLLADTRTSGSISFTSQGIGMEQVFAAMTGVAQLSIDHRADRDWKRPPVAEKQFKISGETKLVLQDKRIMGLQISRLAVDSIAQNLTGSVSLLDGRKPWLIADLASDKLDLDGLRSGSAKEAPGQPDSDLRESLRQLGESRISLQAKSVLIAKLPLSDVALQVATAPGQVGIERLDFSLGEGSLTSRGEVSVIKDEATFALEATVTELPLDKILDDVPAAARVPVSGAVALHSSGNTLGTLVSNLSGDVKLATVPGKGQADAALSGEIDMSVHQTDNGMRAEVRRFQLQDTDLAGSLEYRATTPPLLTVEISGGKISLLPWEAKDAPAATADSKPADSRIARTARAGAELIGDVITAPLRLISGPREAATGEKLFSQTPIDFKWLHQHEARIKGRLDTLVTREGEAGDLEFKASLLGGQLDVEAHAGSLNGGPASARLTVDTLHQNPAIALNGTFSRLHGDLIKADFPRSGYFDLTTAGRSQAEMAGNLNGMVYLELGAGNLDYSKLMLLTADVAMDVFESLIPGHDKTQPRLECAVTLGVFNNGIGSTPYGYAARTNQANLVGKVELNLKKELIRLNLSSGSRRGLGFAIGNVFSNTVAVEGPITNPKVIPDAAGLLWRSWAAVMTAGLSLVGESVLKRALASENPCTSVQTHIRKNICGSGQPGAASELVCPPA
ncbi:MAG: AsmA family protein [Halioglobus sp.]|nr:AsmA family protein [Halioglobus sp.]